MRKSTKFCSIAAPLLAVLTLCLSTAACDLVSSTRKLDDINLLGADTIGVVNATLPFSVYILGEDGDPVKDLDVRFKVQSGRARVEPKHVTTDRRGFASTTITLDSLPGRVVLHVQAGYKQRTFGLRALLPRADAHRVVSLPESASTFVVHEARGMLYASLLPSKQVVEISLLTGEILRRFQLEGTAYNLRLSLDGEHLLAPMCGAGAVALLSLDSWEHIRLDVAEVTRGRATWDALEIDPGRLVVVDGNVSECIGPNHHDGVFALLDRATGTWHRFYPGPFNFITPALTPSPDGRYLYVHEQGIPEELTRVVVERIGKQARVSDFNQGDAHDPETPSLYGNGVYSARYAPPSRDGRYLFLGGGQVMEAASWRVVKRMPWFRYTREFHASAHPTVSLDGQHVHYSMAENLYAWSIMSPFNRRDLPHPLTSEGVLVTHDARSLEQVRSVRVPYNWAIASHPLSDGGLVVLTCATYDTCRDIYRVNPARIEYTL